MSYEARLNDHEKRIINLEEARVTLGQKIDSCGKWQTEAEELHAKMYEQNRRSEDALNHNTESNLLLIASNEAAIASNKELTQAFTAFKEHIEKEHDPVIAWYKPFIETGEDIKGFIRVNKVLVRWIVGLVITGAAFYTALQTFT